MSETDLERAARLIRALHSKAPDHWDDPNVCTEDGFDWPCRTIRILDGDSHGSSREH